MVMVIGGANRNFCVDDDDDDDGDDLYIFLHDRFNHFSCILILKMTKALPSKGRPWPRNDDNDQGFLQPLSWQPGPGVDRSFCHLSSGKPPCHSLNKENSDAA